jgi:hypothetical protein
MSQVKECMLLINKIGLAFGISSLHQKQNTFYGGLVRAVFRLVFAYRKSMFRALCSVRSAIAMMKAIDMFYSLVRQVYKLGNQQDWEMYWRGMFSKAWMCNLLSIIFALMKINK